MGVSDQFCPFVQDVLGNIRLRVFGIQNGGTKTMKMPDPNGHFHFVSRFSSHNQLQTLINN
jgi:hypothetical protein